MVSSTPSVEASACDSSNSRALSRCACAMPANVEASCAAGRFLALGLVLAFEFGECVEVERDEARVQGLAGLEGEDVARALHRMGRAVRAWAAQRVVAVGHREHARADRDVRAGEPRGYPLPSQRSWCA